MNPIAFWFVSVNALLLLFLPRRWAFVPLLAAASFMTMGQGVDLGVFTFTVVRILAAAGFVRVLVRGERLPGRFHALDACMVLWAAWACFSSLFHDDPRSDFVFKLGKVYDACGIYFLLRVFTTSREDVLRLSRVAAVLLTLVAAGMLFEHVAFRNVFAVFGGVPETPMVREGRIRAFGPFMHPILAGTVGAVTLPLMVGLWSSHRLAACTGSAACLAMIAASGSSGPVLSAAAAIVALCAWPYRYRMRLFRWAAVFTYVALDMVMKVPAYYLIARIDLAGGSTGWHRAALIEASIRHFGEWWWAGTDYTRHWMPTGVSWNPNHTDITNHFLHMGVIGGLPLMLLFITTLAVGFRDVGRSIREKRNRAEHWCLWTLGAALFAQAATMVSVSYFDQSFLFLYLTLAAIGSGAQTATARSKRSAAWGPSSLEASDPGPRGAGNPARKGRVPILTSRIATA